MRVKYLVAIGCVGIVGACVFSAFVTPDLDAVPERETAPVVRYGSQPWQVADVRDRQSETAIVMLHSGGWFGGTRADTHGQCEYFAAYTVVCPEYRLGTPDDPSGPYVLDDIDAAVRFVRAMQEVKRIVLMGFSAGAHLALLYAYEHPEAIDLVVSVAGCGDLSPVNPEMTSCLLGPELDGLTEFSPETHVSEMCPSTIIVHGRHDSILPCRCNDGLIERLDAARVPCVYYSVAGEHRDALTWAGLAGAVDLALASLG